MARLWARLWARPWVIPLIAACCLLFSATAFGCPNCKDAVNTADPEGMNLARGYFYSILLMLAMPATLISSFGIYVWREMQRQKRAGTSAPGADVAGMVDRYRLPLEAGATEASPTGTHS